MVSVRDKGKKYYIHFRARCRWNLARFSAIPYSLFASLHPEARSDISWQKRCVAACLSYSQPSTTLMLSPDVSEENGCPGYVHADYHPHQASSPAAGITCLHSNQRDGFHLKRLRWAKSFASSSASWQGKWSMGHKTSQTQYSLVAVVPAHHLGRL